MDRAAMIKELVEMGFDEADFEGVKDELLAKMLKLSGDEEGGDADADQDSDDVADHAEGDEEDGAHDDMSDEAIAAMPEDKKAEKLREYRDRFAEDDDHRGPHKNAEEDAAMKIGTGKFSEAAINAMVDKAVAKSLEKHAGAAVARVQKFAEQAEGEQKRAALSKFVEANVNAGKIEPWEMDDTSKQPTLLDRLMACDASTPVFKFSEKGKTHTLTQLEVEMEAIEARPIRKHGERIAAGNGKANLDAELAKVEAHYESFAEDFHRLHTTKEEMVEAFKAQRKHNPDTTADTFLAVGRAR